jgi:hypothetical protein
MRQAADLAATSDTTEGPPMSRLDMHHVSRSGQEHFLSINVRATLPESDLNEIIFDLFNRTPGTEKKESRIFWNLTDAQATELIRALKDERRKVRARAQKEAAR